jgi:hypothetical protein
MDGWMEYWMRVTMLRFNHPTNQPSIRRQGSTAAMVPFGRISLHSLWFLQSWPYLSERSSAWLERVDRVHEVAGSNPVAPTIFFFPPAVQIYPSDGHLISPPGRWRIFCRMGKRKQERRTGLNAPKFYFPRATCCKSRGLAASAREIFRLASPLLKARCANHSHAQTNIICCPRVAGES